MQSIGFRNANDAFNYYYTLIHQKGVDRNGTKAMFNIGFYIENPKDRIITESWRKFNPSYAKEEWEWYMSGNRSVDEIKKKAKIWDKMHNGDNIVNSNYGWQWNRNGQLDYVVNELTKNPESRRAYITLYDGKEHADYEKDTPCTLNIGFYIAEQRLNMNVHMRSNDLWYGFCNDQYCFSKLQEHLANKMGLEMGIYYHHANDFHIYNEFLNRKHA